VLTFIRRNGEGSTVADSVISMCKVKSVEYQALRLLVDLLQSAIEEGTSLETKQDALLAQFKKDFKVWSRNIDEALESHPESFFIDLFKTAYDLIAKKSEKDKEMYQDLLFNDSVKFMAMALKANEETHNGTRYVGMIELKSQILGEIPQTSASQPVDEARQSSQKTPRIKDAA
jgi:hypothetical protein